MNQKKILILAFFCAITITSFAQQEIKLNNDNSLQKLSMPKDTLPAGVLSLKQELALYNPLSSIRYNADFNTTRERISFMGKDSRMSKDFLSPLYNKYLEDQKMAPYMYILGVAQGAACGYLLYEHISKYGSIWENKKK